MQGPGFLIGMRTPRDGYIQTCRAAGVDEREGQGCYRRVRATGILAASERGEHARRGTLTVQEELVLDS